MTPTLEARTYTPTNHELDMLDFELSKIAPDQRIDYLLKQDIFGVKRMVALLHQYDSSGRIETPIGKELLLALYAHVAPEMQKPEAERSLSIADAVYVKATFTKRVTDAKRSQP